MEKFIRYKGEIYTRVDENSTLHPTLRAQVGAVSSLGAFCKMWAETLAKADLSGLDEEQLKEIHLTLDKVDRVAEKAKADILAYSSKISKYVKK